jgi:hypothetical protein
MATYTYSIQDAFIVAHKVDGTKFRKEIVDSAIVTAVDYVNTDSTNCYVVFKADLSEGDKAILDGLVAAHDGVPLPTEALPVSLPGISLTHDGRINIRNTTANLTKNFYLRVFSWKTSTGNVNLTNLSPDGTPMGDVTITMFDADGNVVTDGATCVKCYVDLEPAYNYDVIGGWMDIPDSIRNATPGTWFIGAVGVPDIPRQYGGSVPFIGQVDLALVRESRVISDGRGTQYMVYNAQYHTSKIRYIIRHPAGASEWLQIFVETFV